MAKLTDTNKIALKISTEERNGYFHIRAHAYVVTSEGRIDCPQYENATIGGLFLTGLTVSCQGHAPSELTGSLAGRLYAFEHGYDVSGLVTSRDAVKIAKSLTTIDRRLDKLYQTRGAADTFAEYVTRIAEAIGASEIITRRDNFHSFAWGSPDAYRRMTLGDGRYHITRLTAEWVERVNPSAARVAS